MSSKNLEPFSTILTLDIKQCEKRGNLQENLLWSKSLICIYLELGKYISKLSMKSVAIKFDYQSV